MIRRENRAFGIEQDSLRFKFLRIGGDRIITVGPVCRGQQPRVIHPLDVGEPGGKVHLTSRPSDLYLREVNHVAWFERLRGRV